MHAITRGVVVHVYRFVAAVPVDPGWLRNKVETKHCSSLSCFLWESIKVSLSPVWSMLGVGLPSSLHSLCFLLHQQLIAPFCRTWDEQVISLSLWLLHLAISSCFMHWSSFRCFCITSMLLSYVCPHVLLCVYECACSDLPLLSAPLFLCCADSLPPTGFRSTKLQSVGEHWSAPVWGLPPTRQLGLPGQQLQLYPGWPRGRGGTSFTGDKPPAPPQRTWDLLYRETMRRTVDTNWNNCA